MKSNTRFSRFLHQNFVTDAVFRESEIRANKLVALTMLLNSGLIVVLWILNHVGVFMESAERMNILLYQGLPELLIPAGLCLIFKGKKPWLKYLLMLEFVVVLARLDSVQGYNATLLIVIPLLLSCCYYSEGFTYQIAIFSLLLFGVSAFCGAYFDMAPLDTNFYRVTSDVTLQITDYADPAFRELGLDPAVRTMDFMLQSFMPRALVFVLLSVICGRIAARGRTMVLENAATVRENSRIESELNLATDIQAAMLPSIFPPFPEHDEFDIYATMDPAKEVGGDFYDFFMLDENRVAVVVADVSGKGVPAALFMVIAKALLKNYTQYGLSPAEVFTTVNHLLCEGNESGLFVTAWLGVLELDSGKLTYVNAGHNPPYIINNSNEFVRLVSRPGFVLAGIDEMNYTQKELTMHPGDRLFLYTDGIPEAVNAKLEQYSEERMKNWLNAHRRDDGKSLLRGLREDINIFVGDADQFDDITMLILDYQKPAPAGFTEQEFPAEVRQLTAVTEFVESHIDCPMKTAMALTMAVEEIFVNIANYAYPDSSGSMQLGIRQQDDVVTLRFVDRGKPFNPLQIPEPDVEKAAADSSIGGLGIFMVKQTMDDVQYSRSDDRNILTITKHIG